MDAIDEYLPVWVDEAGDDSDSSRGFASEPPYNSCDYSEATTDDSAGECDAASAWSTTSVDAESWTDGEASEIAWSDFGCPRVDELTVDKNAPPGSAIANRARDDSALRPPQRASRNLKPLRMTVPMGQRPGDVCHARVPSTGQRVAALVPAGLRPGDKFLVMYRPEGAKPCGVSTDPGSLAHTVEVAMANAKISEYELSVAELVALLQAGTWADSEPPVRPFRLGALVEGALFRELRRFKRRNKPALGKIDRWKNSGGKHAVVTIDIPAELRCTESNVLVQRHGRVVRVDGTQVRYAQWSFGTRSADDKLEELKGFDDRILFRLFPDTSVPDKVHTQETLSPVSSQSSPAGVAELDYGLLPDSIRKHNFDGAFHDEFPHKKARRSVAAPLCTSLAALAILGVGVYSVQQQSTETPSYDQVVPQETAVTCSGTPDNLLHADASSMHNCTQHVGQTCQLLCEPGYEPHGTLRCGYGITVIDGNAACKKCTDGKFSEDGRACRPCTACTRSMTAATCTHTTNTRCVRWKAQANQTQAWHIPQFAAVWGDSSSTFVFGGKGSAVSFSNMASHQMDGCPTTNAVVSNELWARESSQHWRLLGGSVGRTSSRESVAPIGGIGWPAPRSSAASWNIPSEVAAQNALGPAAVLFSGSFHAPCATDNTDISVEQMINPSDLWVYGQPQGAPSGWTLVGGEQSWAAAAEGLVSQLEVGYLHLQTVGGDLTRSTTATATWPLGRHDAHTWVLGTSLLLFSGAMDLYTRVAGFQQTSKGAYLLNDYWLIHLGTDSITWELAGGAKFGTAAVPRPPQPGPRVFGATWASVNKTSGADTAWLFGGIGSTYSTGQGSYGSAVAAAADGDLRTMCDLWTYSKPTKTDKSQWKLVGACVLDMPPLTAHAEQLGLRVDRISHIMLTEAVLATTWVDSDQNLWLFGGAQCKEMQHQHQHQNCPAVVKDALVPRMGDHGRRLTENSFVHDYDYDVSGANPAPIKSVVDPTDGFGSEPWLSRYNNYDPPHATPVGPTPVGPNIPSYGPNIPSYGPPPAGHSSSEPTRDLAPIPCTDELWMFDTSAMEWALFTAEQASTSKAWPVRECGAVAVPPRTNRALTSELIGGWQQNAFATCGGEGSPAGDCSSASWFFGPI